ncbi:MAG: NAD(P)-dependent alcohol dehydrogenase [Gluconacetobacter diazotrophicus]|nr:NAD(P)-dependent alcohol dehydrogenase [Gluconacetobacter diazotrophicus]
MTTTDTKAYAKQNATDRLAPFTIPRRAPGATDVAIEVLYCGVCHSDIHTGRSEWAGTMYPCVTGHEIVGRVTAVGDEVTKFKAGDLAAVGCMVDSCRTCATCQQGLENYCLNGFTGTYNSPDKKSGGHTFGGYSTNITVEEGFCLRVPENLDLKAVAPLLCAGITTYSPLRHWKVGKGQKVGIVGLGGLGHMGVKFAHAMGAHTVLFTTSPNKVEDGKKLGADEVVISKNADEMKKHAGSFDFILDCVSAEHDINAYLQLLKLDGTVCLVGAPEKPLPTAAFNVILPRRNFAGSCIGGIPETQEMLDFCAEHGIVCDVEMINIDYINEAWDRVVKADVKYRFVIDMASLKQQ